MGGELFREPRVRTASVSLMTTPVERHAALHVQGQIRFEWDSRKAEMNRRKHGVSFEEARSVFYDEQALL